VPILADTKTRNIEEYNQKSKKPMPYIVIVTDEFSDMMVMDSDEMELLVIKLAQKALAIGIHLVVSTSRPSVDIITGLIKANIPARIALTTASKIDSRTIIDMVGPEKLMGNGDLFYSDAHSVGLRRMQGAYISDAELVRVTDFLRAQATPQYNFEV